MTLSERAQNHLRLNELGLSSVSLLGIDTAFSKALIDELRASFANAGLQEPALKPFGDFVSILQGKDSAGDPYWIRIMVIEPFESKVGWIWTYNADITGNLPLTKTDELVMNLTETAQLVAKYRAERPGEWKMDPHQSIVQRWIEEIDV